jgi:hypothetical protein
MRLSLVKERHSCFKMRDLLQLFKNWKSNYQILKPNMIRIEYYGRISLLSYNIRKTKPSLINKNQLRNLRLSLNSYKREAQLKRTSLKILMQLSSIPSNLNLSSNLRNKANSFPKRKQTKLRELKLWTRITVLCKGRFKLNNEKDRLKFLHCKRKSLNWLMLKVACRSK